MLKLLSDLCPKVLYKKLMLKNFLYTFVLFPIFLVSDLILILFGCRNMIHNILV